MNRPGQNAQDEEVLVELEAEEAPPAGELLAEGFTRGLIRGGFWDSEPPGCSSPAPEKTVWFTCNHYDITVTEPDRKSVV